MLDREGQLLKSSQGMYQLLWRLCFQVNCKNLQYCIVLDKGLV